MSKYRDQSLTPLVSFALLAIVACASPLPEQPALPVSPVSFGGGEQREVSNVVVLADGSGSMYMAKTFPQAKSLAQSFVKALPEKSARGTSNYEAGFIGFGGDERVLAPLSAFNRQKLGTAANETHIMGQLDGTGGTTPIHKLIGEIGDQLEGKSGKTAVVLFGDGVPTDAAASLVAAKLLTESRRDPVCFHGVQVGDDPAGRAFLEQLAATSPCGSVRSASEVSSAASLQSYAKSVLVGKAMPMTRAPVKSDSACSGTIRLRGIEFAFNKAAIDPVGSVVLDAAASTLAECPNIAVRIDGHTDSVGPEAYNLALSERRAEAVRDYLAGTGIPTSRMTTRGFGETQPVADNSTSEGRARNRRVELKPQ